MICAHGRNRRCPPKCSTVTLDSVRFVTVLPAAPWLHKVMFTPFHFGMPLTRTILGYWMPFEAAKAVAATFCYHIRYALTPLFGLDFVSMCIRPGEEGFGHMVIDREIVRRCTEQANGYRALSRESSLASSPITPVSATHGGKWTNRSLRPRTTGQFGEDNGYYTDTEDSDKYLASPQPNFSWTALNTPRSISSQFQLHSPQSLMTDKSLIRGCDAPPNSPDSSGSDGHTNSKLALKQLDDDYDESVSPGSSKAQLAVTRRRMPAISTKDSRAAYLLMQLHFADASLKEGSKKRRASS